MFGPKGGEQTGPNSVDRGKPGSKYHLVVDRNGIPLAVRLSAANAHDTTQLLPLIDVIPSIRDPRGKPERPRKRPAKLHGDKAYDLSALRRALRARRITPSFPSAEPRTSRATSPARSSVSPAASRWLSSSCATLRRNKPRSPPWCASSRCERSVTVSPTLPDNRYRYRRSGRRPLS